MNNVTMLILITLLYFMTLLLNKIVFKELFRINIIFNTIWIPTIFLYLVNDTEWYQVSPIVNKYAFITLLVYNFIYYLVSLKKRNAHVSLGNNDKIFLIKNYKSIISSSLLYFFNIILWIFHLPFFIKALNILQSQGFSRLRIYAYDGSAGLANTMQLMVLQDINYMFYMFMVLLWTIGFINRCTTRKLTFFAIIDLISYVLTFGGRGPIFMDMIFCLASIIIFHRTSLTTWIIKNKKIIIMILITIVSGLYLVSLRSFGNSIITTLFAYFSAPFIFLSEAIKKKIIHYGLTKGAGMFEFIVFPIEILLNLSGLENGYVSSQITTILDKQLLISSRGYHYNALGTMMAVFLFDFGYAGIFIGAALFAFLGTLIENCFIKKKNMTTLCTYIFMIHYTVISVQSYYIRIAALFAFIFILIFTSSKYKVKFIFGKRYRD